MKDKSKILPRVIIVILVVTLISTLVLSSVYAKYVSKKDPGEVNSRPAAFELIMKTPLDDSIDFNFAVDGEPGTPIGHTETEKYYDFEVKTSDSEVASRYFLKIQFSNKIKKLIVDGRENKMADGVSCNFDVQMLDKATSKYVSIWGDGTDTVSTDGAWQYEGVVNPNVNPDGSFGITADGKDVVTQYRLVMIVYNNTDMPADGNTDRYVLSTNGIEISVTSKQENPNYKGQYAGS